MSGSDLLQISHLTRRRQEDPLAKQIVDLQRRGGGLPEPLSLARSSAKAFWSASAVLVASPARISFRSTSTESFDSSLADPRTIFSRRSTRICGEGLHRRLRADGRSPFDSQTARSRSASGSLRVKDARITSGAPPGGFRGRVQQLTTGQDPRHPRTSPAGLGSGDGRGEGPKWGRSRARAPRARRALAAIPREDQWPRQARQNGQGLELEGRGPSRFAPEPVLGSIGRLRPVHTSQHLDRSNRLVLAARSSAPRPTTASKRLRMRFGRSELITSPSLGPARWPARGGVHCAYTGGAVLHDRTPIRQEGIQTGSWIGHGHLIDRGTGPSE
jgi:hypothetical protein